MKCNNILLNAWYLRKPTTHNTLNNTVCQLPLLDSSHIINKFLFNLNKFNLTNIKIYSMLPQLNISNLTNFSLKEHTVAQNENGNHKDPNEKNLAMFKMYDWIILSTANSNKHCQSSLIKLNRWYKLNYNKSLLVEGKDVFHYDTKRNKKILKKRNKNDLKDVVERQDRLDNLAWFLVESKLENVMINVFTQEKRSILGFDELLEDNNFVNLLSKGVDNSNFENDNNNANKGNETSKSDKLHQGMVENLPKSLKGNSISDKLQLMFEQKRSYSSFSKPLPPPVTFQTDGIAIPNDCLENLKLISSELEKTIIQGINNHNTEDKDADITNDKPKLTYMDWFIKFQNNWPIMMPKNVPNEFWEIRLNYFINLTSFEKYQVERIMVDFFLYKKTRGFELTSEELINYIKLVIIEINQKKLSIYHANKIIINVVKLYNWSTLSKDWSKIVHYILQTFYIEKHTKSKKGIVQKQMIGLPVFNKLTLPYLIDCNKTFPLTKRDFITISVSILRTLAKMNNWKLFINYWYRIDNMIEPREQLIMNVPHLQINVLEKPWLFFLQFINESKDIRLVSDIIIKGHLLPIRQMFSDNLIENRDSLELIKLEINKLFEFGDPQNEFVNIKQFILNEEGDK